MGRFRHYLSLAYGELLKGLNFISLMTIFFIAILMTVDVIARSFFNHPLHGTSEIAKSLLPAIVFLSLAYTLRKDRHVRVEIIIDNVPKRTRAIFDIVAFLMGFFCFFFVAYFSIEPAWQGWLVKEYEGIQLHVPVYPVRFITILGAGLLSTEFLLKIIDRCRSFH